MKNKPVKEGYKLWLICYAATGFFLQSTSGCKSRKYKLRREGGHWEYNHYHWITPQKKYKEVCVGMDNFLTLPCMLISAREICVAVVGTARAKRGGPPKYMKNISDSRFNTLHWINDKRTFQIQWWIDNNVVTKTMELHTLEYTTRRIQEKYLSGVSFEHGIWKININTHRHRWLQPLDTWSLLVRPVDC